MPTYLSLFSGIGGIDLGLDRAGFRCVGQVEWDDFCQQVLAKHWPTVPKFRDIKEVTSGQLTRLGTIDLVAGGPPCQSVSEAGNQKAQEDARWLWPEFARVIRLVRPRVVFVENVPGLLTAKSGKAFSEIQVDLAQAGYDTEWACVPASAFGASHRRYRIVLLAYSPHNDGTGESTSVFDTCPPKQCQPRGSSGREGALGRWLPEPDLGRVANGLPSRLVRPQLTALGNAVVPSLAEYVGTCIRKAFF